ncbi:DNA repair protein RecN [Sphingobacterium bovistauri]|uniref:DNA repair protein RecN n=1 Tax=Sphingobacterium bovistauri TaxID=2781959 RepID=A0ABS7Z8V4_9SPHI|nr:DNA repair protein RecN [Sphingobacterium bovistauri]MCA5005967.1 DNA repair protein RecN [Sphingobacterium bovistauri]
MLSRLLIKNYALIDNLDITFDKGLNIITGETGAGKSILMGALGLILGNRVEGKQFFNEDKKCVIEGYFLIAPYDLKVFFEENELEYEDETIIRREIAVDGKSRAFVNDSPVNLTLLKSLGERLIDIHSQHATLQINTEDFQLFVLDAIADNESIIVEFRKELQQLRLVDKKLKSLKEESRTANAELDYNQFLFDELEKLNVREGEVKELEEEQGQLENAEEIKHALLAANHLLEDGEQNALALLKESIQQIQQASRYFSDADDFANRLQSAYIEIKDVSAELANQESAVNLDEQRLDIVNSRLSDIYSLLKKHHVDSEVELIQLRHELEEKLQIALNHDEILSKLEVEKQQQQEKVIAIGQVIHDKRSKVKVSVEEAVQNTLAHVGMSNAKLDISLTLQSLEKATSKGMDAVQFLFSANKGQSLQPIHKVASGGELSRVMLAIKSLVAKNSALPTIIFDEIDTGISGEVALRVGEVMQGLASNMQVLAITHLPQIASKGTSHFKVYKEDRDDKTRSNILLLNPAERVVEVAQMLSGANPGEAALEHAKSLLSIKQKSS